MAIEELIYKNSKKFYCLHFKKFSKIKEIVMIFINELRINFL
jgi:hypothetical protein